MTLDASIILGGRQTQQYDPMGSARNALALAGSMEQFQASRDARARDAALRSSTVMGPDGDVDIEATTQKLAQAGAPPDYIAILRSKITGERAVAAKSQHEAEKAKLEEGDAKLKQAYGVIFSLGNNPTPEEIARRIGDLHNRIGGLDQMRLPKTQPEVPRFLQETKRALLGAKETLTQARLNWEAMARARRPASPGAQAGFDLQNWEDGGWLPPGSPDEYGDMPLQQPGAPTPTAPPVNALTASPQAVNSGPPGNANAMLSQGAADVPEQPVNALAAPQPTPETIAAPQADIYSMRPALQTQFQTASRGKIGPFSYNTQGDIVENPLVTAYGIKKAAAGAPKMTLNPGEKKWQQNMADQIADYQKEAKAAHQISNQVDTITDVLAKYSGGPTQGLVQNVNRYFPWAKDITNAADFAGAISARLGPAMRVLGSGSTSDYEAKQALAALPSLSMYAEGRAVLGKVFRAIAERSAFGADLRLKMLRNDDTDDMEQRVQEAIEAKFKGKARKDGTYGLLDDADLAVLEGEKSGRKAGKKNVQPPTPMTVQPQEEMDWKQFNK